MRGGVEGAGGADGVLWCDGCGVVCRFAGPPGAGGWGVGVCVGERGRGRGSGWAESVVLLLFVSGLLCGVSGRRGKGEHCT